MPLPPDAVPSSVAVCLPANGNTIAAEELRNELVFAAEFGAGTLVDASAVQNVGQAVLQVLIAARRAATDCDRPYEITGASGAFRSRVHDCGLADAIGLPNERPSAL